jgi:hypothetical protein
VSVSSSFSFCHIYSMSEYTQAGGLRPTRLCRPVMPLLWRLLLTLPHKGHPFVNICLTIGFAFHGSYHAPRDLTVYACVPPPRHCNEKLPIDEDTVRKAVTHDQNLTWVPSNSSHPIRMLRKASKNSPPWS